MLLNQHSEILWQKFRKYWDSNSTDFIAPIEHILNDHPFYAQTLSLSKYGFCVIDVKKMQYLYISSNTGEIAGWSHEEYMKGGIAFAFSVILPGFQAGIIRFSQLSSGYFKNLPEAEKPTYRAYYDYRINSPTGNKQLLQQDYVLKFDEAGHITMKLAICMDVKNQKNERSMHLRLTNGKQNSIYEFEIKTEVLRQLGPLGERELEVAKLVSQSYDSVQIAQRLKISDLTVKTHRRNMLKKLHVKDSLEMINLLKVLGFV